MRSEPCRFCDKADALKCQHQYCTHASYGDIVLPPLECHDCTRAHHGRNYVVVDGSSSSLTNNDAVLVAQKPSVKLSIGTGPTVDSATDETTERMICWRCQLLKLNCDGKDPCKPCGKQKKDDQKYLACQYEDLRDQLKGVYDIGVGTGNIFIRGPGNSRQHYRASIAFDPPAYKYMFKDFKESPLIRETCLTQPPIPILDFLEQFYDVNWRWTNCYEEATADIIKHCAHYQYDLLVLRGIGTDVVNHDDDGVLIALALRCLALSHEIFHLDGSVPYRIFDDGETRYTPSMLYESDPHIDLWISQRDWGCLRDPTDTLPVLLDQILEMFQMRLFKGGPDDWPVLLCTLCILHLIAQNLDPGGMFLQSLRKGGLAMKHVTSVLCSLFETLTKSNHPLCYDWRLDEFNASCQCKLGARCMKEFHDLWLKRINFESGAEKAEYAAKSFCDRFDDFVMGFL